MSAVMAWILAAIVAAVIVSPAFGFVSVTGAALLVALAARASRVLLSDPRPGESRTASREAHPLALVAARDLEWLIPVSGNADPAPTPSVR